MCRDWRRWWCLELLERAPASMTKHLPLCKPPTRSSCRAYQLWTTPRKAKPNGTPPRKSTIQRQLKLKLSWLRNSSRSSKFPNQLMNRSMCFRFTQNFCRDRKYVRLSLSFRSLWLVKCTKILRSWRRSCLMKAKWMTGWMRPEISPKLSTKLYGSTSLTKSCNFTKIVSKKCLVKIGNHWQKAPTWSAHVNFSKEDFRTIRMNSFGDGNKSWQNATSKKKKTRWYLEFSK